ncbi:ferrochelatase [Mucilaginibacter sp.]|uniref:ferrochelatase n=1 Tax=Mucilaginibacter sp. TaxID=1882438 RepID=UPI0025CEF019|nr:ferrochelatase [Mucilaginibacter sp.]
MRKGILLVNLGTPISPSVNNVRKYLAEFLMDPRVITLHRFLRFLLVRCIIVPFRAAKSARLYRKIWDSQTGSPLLHYSNMQRQLLKMELGRGYVVELAMRYQYPSIELALNKLKTAGVESIRVIPMFPQYASATSGSVIAKVMETMNKWDVIPSVSFVNSFHDDEFMIEAFAENGRKYPAENYDHVLFSFHGLPEAQLIQCDASGSHCQRKKGCCDTLTSVNFNCYAAQAHHTARLIAIRLGILPGNYTVCFQSRLGRAEWIKPYTADVIANLAQTGYKRLLVFCPAFVADCLETIYEIGVEYREMFLTAGGQHLQLVESLNGSPIFIKALQNMASQKAPVLEHHGVKRLCLSH